VCPHRHDIGATVFALTMAASSLLLPSLAGGQENFEIQVYGSETTPAGSTMLELHSNVAAQGTTRTENGIVPSQGAVHATVEVTHGWTPWFETAVYLFTSIQPDGGWQWVGNHVRPRIRVPESWGLPVGLGLSTEVGYQRRSFSVDTWSVEIRPIIDGDWGRWYAAFNPVLDVAIKGEGAGRAPGFAPALKISYRATPRISPGIEYYGSPGPLSGFDRLRDQQHQLFPVLDLDLGPQWEFNAGVGIGLTPGTDRLLFKLILGYRFDWS
jgi:hypothetical protein